MFSYCNQQEVIMFKKVPVVSTVLLAILSSETLISSQAVNAQSAYTPFANCQASIESVKAQIKNTLKVVRVVSVSSHPNDSPFPDAGNGLSISVEGINLTQKQSGKVTDFMSSPMLQKAMAKTIIMSCPSISSVSFGQFGTDWGAIYGSIGIRDNVVEFTCPDGYEHGRGGGRKLKWVQFCSL
jgi:hypothetical protein